MRENYVSQFQAVPLITFCGTVMGSASILPFGDLLKGLTGYGIEL